MNIKHEGLAIGNKLVLICLLLCVACSSTAAQSTRNADANADTNIDKASIDAIVAELDKEFARGSIATTELAELALSKLELVQSQVQSHLQAKEVACHENFFTNSCLLDVRLKKRQLQEILRQISIEAKSFLRRSRVAKSQEQADKN
ncbi:hypothetical protein [Undibacterium flavidum]|uniref:Secreted protein n=1 Tax=Undibacterium flavidum TaxID=2762297 RepID=A0ABR6YFY4_9BURK|nr:hypothetical protein [Undibacterium flavidum]MBC3875389.1 hypothetical protein [Undibacterium flavidum]